MNPMNDRTTQRHLLRRTVQRVAGAVVTLLVIAFLALFTLIMAERGRAHIPAPIGDVTVETLTRTAMWIVQHPATYLWHKVDEPALSLVLRTFGHSAGLLLVSLAIASTLGILLGFAMAKYRGRLGAAFTLLLSVIGVSTPSFLLAMLLWIVNIQIHRRFDVPALPPTGFGWDQHLIMPALVLAMRPLAQIAQITFVALSDIVGQDFVRTAKAKGLSERLLRNRHVVPNIAVPVLTTLGTSLRFSLASLPVVEYFFLWPGLGLVLLEAIDQENAPLVMDLIVALGLFFLLVNLALELIFPFLDPRSRGTGDQESRNLGGRGSAWRGFIDAIRGVKEEWRISWLRLRGRQPVEDTLPALPVHDDHVSETQPLLTSRRVARSFFSNSVAIVGTVLVLGFVLIAAFGPQLTNSNPYQLAGVMMIDGKIGAPPFNPSSTFPWGTDHIGRDIQAMVLWGARQTLSLALFGTVARLLLGTLLGLLAGWWQGGRFDRLVSGAVGVWAAFPVTLFAMLIIQGLGIQQGTWVFIVALCIVGWGEVAQFVRRQVISIKPQLYIESARSVGSSSARILTQHVMPHLVAPLLVLGILEMGGVLMLLAELGFLSVFLGGGFKVEMTSEQVAFFSDVPEWGSMLANIRDWWRSYPWMAWYPGLAFFLSILALNLWGEGLRRFVEESRVNVSRLLNRYTALAGVGVVVALVLVLRGSTPLGLYQSTARSLDSAKALGHIETLSSAEFEGRETGTPGATKAAQYIAQQMEEIGLSPAGDLVPTKEKNSFIQSQTKPRYHLIGVPRLDILDAEGDVTESFTYRRDFVDMAGPPQVSRAGSVIGVAVGSDPGTLGSDPYLLGRLGLGDKIMLIADPGEKRVNLGAAAGVLIVSDDPETMWRKFLYNSQSGWDGIPPRMYVTSETADRLLATAGSSLAELEQLQAALQPGEASLTSEGAQVSMEIPLSSGDAMDEKYLNVIGFIPGTGAQMGSKGAALDNQVIMVTAYYDGLGVGPDGTLYPGANDNASGVATMLELARALMQSDYAPKKTVMFVAWAGGDRLEGLSVTDIMNAKIGFSSLSVEAVIELSGMGAGSGYAVALGDGSSYRLIQLYEKAAQRMGVSATTRGRDPHYGLSTQTAFGGRDALSLYVSWDGSDRGVHLPSDVVAEIDPEKLKASGEATLLTLCVLSREVDY